MGTATIAEPKRRTKKRARLAPRYHVVLIDDDDHTYEYVIQMLGDVFGHGRARALELAQEVDALGRVIVWTGPKDAAEEKRRCVHAYGADPRIPRSAGSMSAELELADG